VLIKKKKLPMRELVLRGFLPSFLKVWFYRRKGFRIGKNVYFGLGSVIIGKLVDIKDNAKIGFLTILKSNRIDIGRHVHIGLEIGEDSEIREYVYVAGLKTPDSMLKLGKRCGIFQYCFLNSHMEILN